ncbi:MAG TPA: T9SS type A sorting domain-containing protein [Bacteroidia bacterium]|jgi:hypothetical protein
MKKITTLVALALTASFGFSQSQRLVLTEEFTQASCGPCAAANPSFNAILSSNTNKVVSVKYQTSWPGVDPMNAQNPSEANNRTSVYYGVTGVPDGKQDGVDFYPGSYTQTMINNEYVVTSPFTINLTHTMNVAQDSMFITAVITCTQNVNMTTPKFRLAMIERHISFTSAPGTNGEKDFYNVMRKMYPDENGTAIAGSWTNSQTQTLTYSVKIPSYIYRIPEIAFVGWIQDDATKNVKQAAYSSPLPVPNDAGVTAFSGLPIGCTTAFTPSVTLYNYGSNNLTSCTINYQLNGNPVQTYNWTGTLAPAASTTVALPGLTSTLGTNVFTSYTTNPNSATDANALNDKYTERFFTLNSVTNPYPVTESFTNSTFPPTNWMRFNPDNGPMWLRVATVGSHNITPLGSARMDFVNSTPGNIDDLFMPNTDMSSVTGNCYLTFDVAYAPYDATYADTLDVFASTDCGQTWTQVYSKNSTTLATAPATTSNFTPTSTQWRTESVNMSTYAGSSSLIVKFSAHSGYGNYLYIDNVNLSSSNGVENISGNVSLGIFPNPMNNNATIDLQLTQSSNVEVNVFDVVGRNMITLPQGTLSAGMHLIDLDASKLPSGVYFVKVKAGNDVVTKKIVVQK